MSRPFSWLLLGFACVLFALALGLRFMPGGVSFWTTAVYPVASQVWVPLSERSAIPWTPVLAAVFVLLVGWLLRTASSRGARLAIVASVPLLIWSTFMLGWGLHAWREPVEARLGLETQTGVAADSLTMNQAQALANALERTITESAPTGEFELAAAHASVVDSVAGFAPSVRLPTRVKLVPGWLFGSLGVAGVVSPWTLEVHIDRGLPSWSQAAVAAHEWAHLAGFATEAGAEVVGLVAGLRADHPHARYAAALRAWSRLPREVRAIDALPERARQDLTTARLASERQVPWISNASWGVYEQFLRSQGQPEGLSGYGRGVFLLYQAWRTGSW